MAGNGRRRKRSDGLLVSALAAGLSVKAAAERAGVGARTVHRRLADPTFCQAVEEARREIIGRAVAKLAAASVRAADALRKLVASEDERVRLAAARWILRLMMQARQHEDLERRVAELEARLEPGRTEGPQDRRGTLGLFTPHPNGKESCRESEIAP